MINSQLYFLHFKAQTQQTRLFTPKNNAVRFHHSLPTIMTAGFSEVG